MECENNHMVINNKISDMLVFITKPTHLRLLVNCLFTIPITKYTAQFKTGTNLERINY